MFLSQLCKERSRLLLKYRALQDKLDSLPEGDLVCFRNGHYMKWFQSNGTKPIYISKKNWKLVQQLALKKYYSQLAKELSQEIQILEKSIQQYQSLSIKSTALLDSSSNYHELLKSTFEQFPDELHQWLTSDYIHNASHPEHLIHKTISGQFVRSKSEVIIANSLYRNKIPYRYECALNFDGISYYPDFTICHPQTMEFFFWEHFGMMNNPSYSEKAYNKLKVYANNGIIPSLQLITTYETEDHPIDSTKVQQIIEEYFLA